MLWLLVLPLLLYLALGLLVVPLHLTVESLIRLITIPQELWRIASNPRLRVNHALEHATINVIEEQAGPTTITGMAQEHGFIIRGVSDPRVVRQAAQVGLERLRRGERGLALHRRCGTSVAAANFLLSLVFVLFVLNIGAFRPVTVILAILIAHIIGPVLGRSVQRLFTTTARVGSTEIIGVEPAGDTPLLMGIFMMLSRTPAGFFVRTRYGR